MPQDSEPIGIWRRKIQFSWLLWIVCTVGMLAWLDRITAGTGEDYNWSLFCIWGEQIRYIRESSTPWYDIWYLITGGGSQVLWLYTFIHLVVAAILAWALAGVAGAIYTLGFRDRGNGQDARATGEDGESLS